MILAILLAILITAVVAVLASVIFAGVTSFLVLFGDLIIFAGICYGIYALVKWILKK